MLIPNLGNRINGKRNIAMVHEQYLYQIAKNALKYMIYGINSKLINSSQF